MEMKQYYIQTRTVLRLNNARTWRARLIFRGLQAPCQILSDGLPIEPGLPRDRADTQALSLQIMDQNDLSQCNQLEASLLLLSFELNGPRPVRFLNI